MHNYFITSITRSNNQIQNYESELSQKCESQLEQVLKVWSAYLLLRFFHLKQYDWLKKFMNIQDL